MPHMKKRPVKEVMKKKESLTVEVKKRSPSMKLAHMSDLARDYGRSILKICTILKKKEEIKALDTAVGVTRIWFKERPLAMEAMEKLLFLWLRQKELAGDFVNQAMISQKALTIYGGVAKDLPGPSQEMEFKESHGWFQKFMKRTGVRSVVRHREAASANTKAAEDYVKKFKSFLDSQGYQPQQVFTCDETGLFWKQMPKKTYITSKEKKMLGHKPMKDRLTLLFCAKASGDLKIKPLLVYHSENPRAFKKHNVQKRQLGVIWKPNNKALFLHWLNKVCCPTIKSYLEESGLPLKAVPVMDDAPAHERSRAVGQTV
ncbi:tigger transposable element-derived protein 1-like [Macrobrachium rosenbergii]|uniref:tigger transposable element-derived protein 1-like n=1 Tax=Macrobrachium rosenbergii TaxID=79674 RepID=UPI0034D76B4F